MSYSRPAYNAANATWNGAAAYTRPTYNAADVTWYDGAFVIGDVASSFAAPEVFVEPGDCLLSSTEHTSTISALGTLGANYLDARASAFASTTAAVQAVNDITATPSAFAAPAFTFFTALSSAQSAFYASQLRLAQANAATSTDSLFASSWVFKHCVVQTTPSAFGAGTVASVISLVLDATSSTVGIGSHTQVGVNSLGDFANTETTVPSVSTLNRFALEPYSNSFERDLIRIDGSHRVDALASGETVSALSVSAQVTLTTETTGFAASEVTAIPGPISVDLLATASAFTAGIISRRPFRGLPPTYLLSDDILLPHNPTVEVTQVAHDRFVTQLSIAQQVSVVSRPEVVFVECLP